MLEECAGKPDYPETGAILNALQSKLLERCIAPDFSAYVQEIDDGEASAIAAAMELGCGLLMDDKAGRRMASGLRIPMIGTISVLLLAKRKGFVPELKPLLDRLVSSGYFLGSDLVAAALASAGE